MGARRGVGAPRILAPGYESAAAIEGARRTGRPNGRAAEWGRRAPEEGGSANLTTKSRHRCKMQNSGRKRGESVASREPLFPERIPRCVATKVEVEYSGRSSSSPLLAPLSCCYSFIYPPPRPRRPASASPFFPLLLPLHLLLHLPLRPRSSPRRAASGPARRKNAAFGALESVRTGCFGIGGVFVGLRKNYEVRHSSHCFWICREIGVE